LAEAPLSGPPRVRYRTLEQLEDVCRKLTPHRR